MASKNVEIVADRLKKELNLEVKIDSFQRTYAGIHMRRGGAFLWVFELNNSAGTFIGGCEPLSKYAVKKNRLDISKSWGDIEIICYTPNEKGY